LSVGNKSKLEKLSIDFSGNKLNVESYLLPKKSVGKGHKRDKNG
jgi:hypothetical protein